MECTGFYSEHSASNMGHYPGPCLSYPYCSHYGGAFWRPWSERRRQGLPEQRKSGGHRDPSQRRLSKYNYELSNYFYESLEEWQVEADWAPAHLRRARRLRSVDQVNPDLTTTQLRLTSLE